VPRVLERLREIPEAGWRPVRSLLTSREYEIAKLIAQGLTNHQIAERLVVSPGTVANHVARVLSKLDSESRVQVAVKMATHQTRAQSDAVLGLLERLREIRHASLQQALQHATDVLASTFAADKVDAFLVDPRRDLLVAVGTSQTPMGKRQHQLGLNRLPLSSGGRTAWVFRERRPFLDGHVESDELELPGIRHDLGVRSSMAVPLEVHASVRGVLVVSSARPERFTDVQLQLLQFVSYWVGVVAHEQEPGGDGEQLG
jgi:DNA-binding CsgD family transcriptional regulator